MEINILFLGGAKRVSLAKHFINTASDLGHIVKIFSYELDEKVPIASVGNVLIGKRWNDESIIEDLLHTIKKYRIGIVLPFVDPAISVASKLSLHCPDVFIPVSDISLCNIMFDKVLSSEWFKNHCIDQPESFDNLDNLKYPIILKPRHGSASKGISVCFDQKDIPKYDLSDFLIQKYIEDHTEYSVDCYVSKNGCITSVVPRIRLETSCGEVVKSITVKNDAIIKQSIKILKSGSFRGPITIQFIIDNKSGSIFVMEINPRLGGGVVTSIGAGSGIVKMILDEYLGKTIFPINDWKDNTLMFRYFNEVIFYADNN